MRQGTSDGMVTITLGAQDHAALLNILRRETRAIQRWKEATHSSARDNELADLERISKEVGQ